LQGLFVNKIFCFQLPKSLKLLANPAALLAKSECASLLLSAARRAFASNLVLFAGNFEKNPIAAVRY